MKYLKSYKLFESVDLIPLESTINDIALELGDEGYEVLVDIIWPTKDYDEAPNGEAIQIYVTSPRKESLYSKWRQDRENFARREYEKCKEALDRIDEFLTSKGLEVTEKNGIGKNRAGNFMTAHGTWESGQLEYGHCHQGYDNTGEWEYKIIYKPSKVNEGFFGNRKWWFQKGKKDPDRVFKKDLKMDIDDAFYDLEDMGFNFTVQTPDIEKIKDAREKINNLLDDKHKQGTLSGYQDTLFKSTKKKLEDFIKSSEKTVNVSISKSDNSTYNCKDVVDSFIFLTSLLKDKWNIELKMVDGTFDYERPDGRTVMSPMSDIKRDDGWYPNPAYFNKKGIRKDKHYNEENLKSEFIKYFDDFGDTIVMLTFTFEI